MDHVTQQNAALVEKAATASAEMRAQAAQLVRVVGVFQLASAGATAAARPAALHAVATPRAPAAKTIAAPASRRQPARQVAGAATADDAQWQQF